jgi:hypothetical protein
MLVVLLLLWTLVVSSKTFVIRDITKSSVDRFIQDIAEQDEFVVLFSSTRGDWLQGKRIADVLRDRSGVCYIDRAESVAFDVVRSCKTRYVLETGHMRAGSPVIEFSNLTTQMSVNEAILELQSIKDVIEFGTGEYWATGQPSFERMRVQEYSCSGIGCVRAELVHGIATTKALTEMSRLLRIMDSITDSLNKLEDPMEFDRVITDFSRTLH